MRASHPLWNLLTHPRSSVGCVAYFSMEFMLSEALPIYSGGQGNVAGDQLKAASDDGDQRAVYPYNAAGLRRRLRTRASSAAARCPSRAPDREAPAGAGA